MNSAIFLVAFVVAFACCEFTEQGVVFSESTAIKELNEKSFAKASLYKGQTLTIILPAKPAAEYLWHMKKRVDVIAVLDKTDTGTAKIIPYGESGAPGKQTFKFLAEHCGTSLVKFSYYKGDKVEHIKRKYKVEVEVKCCEQHEH